MPDPLSADDQLILSRLEAGRVTVHVSVKRTVKYGESFQSFESGLSLQLSDPQGAGLTPRLAKLAAMKHTADLVKKVYLDLATAGVLPVQDARDAIVAFKELYDGILGGGRGDGEADRSANRGDVPPAGDDARDAGERAGRCRIRRRACGW